MTGQHEPVVAYAEDGLVHIVAEPYMARALTQALEFTFASGEFEAHFRPDYFHDCSAISNAAIAADQQTAAEVAAVSFVPVESRPQLRLVGGDA